MKLTVNYKDGVVEIFDSVIAVKTDDGRLRYALNGLPSYSCRAPLLKDISSILVDGEVIFKTAEENL